MGRSPQLESDVAIVTGAGRNIGRDIAVTFASEGASVVVADLDAERAEETVAAIEADGRTAVPAVVDVSIEADVVAMVETAEDAFGPVDVLVNNVAINDRETLLDLSVDTWNQVMAVNLRGPFLCTREVAKSMRDADGGRIVNVGSTSAHKGRSSGVAYATSKSGLLNFTRSAARSLAEHGIRVNAVCPGATLTDLVRGASTEEGRERTRRGIPLGRWAQPEDQADAVAYLASPDADFVTGTVLEVDGGANLSHR
jgi:NAD(P)-dependent dehydrogenase (short-subunit alcohol dehydrogenase family)